AHPRRAPRAIRSAGGDRPLERHAGAGPRRGARGGDALHPPRQRMRSGSSPSSQPHLGAARRRRADRLLHRRRTPPSRSDAEVDGAGQDTRSLGARHRRDRGRGGPARPVHPGPPRHRARRPGPGGVARHREARRLRAPPRPGRGACRAGDGPGPGRGGADGVRHSRRLRGGFGRRPGRGRMGRRVLLAHGRSRGRRVRGPIPRLRWSIAALLCAACALNYLDRQTLSVLAATLQAELGFSDVDYSHVTSAFLFSYTVMYAVTGRLVDRLGTRRSFLIGVSGWSAVTMLHALARSALHLSLCRALLGAVQPVNFAAGVKAVSEWFPMRERALAVGIFNAGTALGGALAVPVVSFIALRWGWRWAFVGTGALGFVWVTAWALFYRLPQEHPRLGDAERTLILAEAGDTAAA